MKFEPLPALPPANLRQSGTRSTKPRRSGWPPSPPRPPSRTLQRQLDRFADYYNTVRPHRALGRRTPTQAYAARPKAIPTGVKIPAHYRVRNDTIDPGGTVTLRHNSRLHHIGVGAARRGTRVTLLVDDLHIRVITPRHRPTDPGADPRPQPGLPTPRPTPRPTQKDHLKCNDVPRHPLTVSRDITQSWRGDSNPQPPVYKTGALPIAPRQRQPVRLAEAGGADENRAGPANAGGIAGGDQGRLSPAQTQGSS